MQEQQLLLGVKAAGAMVGLSPWTIRKYIRDGELEAVRLGRRVLVEPESLRKLIQRAKRRPTA